MNAVPALAQGLLGESLTSEIVIQNAPLTLEQDRFMTRPREIDIERFMRARGIITRHGPRGTRYKPIGDWTQSDFDIFRRRYAQQAHSGGPAPQDGLDALATEFFWEQQSLNGGGDGGEGDGGGDGGGGGDD